VSQTRYRTAAVILALGVIWTAGCGDSGPKIVPASGQVLIDGQPLATGLAGFIRFVPKDGRPATGAIDPQTGNFKLTTLKQDDGCIIGTHRVLIILQQTVGQESVSLVPEKYAELNATDLALTVDGPTNTLRVELTGPLKKARPDATPISKDPNRY
jgi:hypothetical protein